MYSTVKYSKVQYSRVHVKGHQQGDQTSTNIECGTGDHNTTECGWGGGDAMLTPTPLPPMIKRVSDQRTIVCVFTAVDRKHTGDRTPQTTSIVLPHHPLPS